MGKKLEKNKMGKKLEKIKSFVSPKRFRPKTRIIAKSIFPEYSLKEA